MKELRKKGSNTDVYFTPTIIWNHEPLIGIPFPGLVYDKLKDMAAQEVVTPCLYGRRDAGLLRPLLHQRGAGARVSVRPRPRSERVPAKQSGGMGGRGMADDLVKVWMLSDEAFRSFPLPILIYSNWGVWYRLLIRPIVPNIEAVPEDRPHVL